MSALPGTVRVTNDLVSTGLANTHARIMYSTADDNDVWIFNTGTPAKSWPSPAFEVRVSPGTSHTDALSLVRGPGTAMALVEIRQSIQEVDVAGTAVPGEVPLLKAVVVQIL